MSKKKYFIDEFVFNKLDLETCYWAGFIAADGSIARKGYGFTVGLAQKDFDHLSKLSKFLKHSHGPNKFQKKDGSKGCVLSCSSKQLKCDLENNFNIIPNKTFIYEPPRFEDNLFRDAFIVGYIDGDGCINLNKNSHFLQLSILGTHKLVSWIQTRFKEIINESCGCISKDRNVYCFTTNKRKAFIILNHLNNISVPKLIRKWSKINFARAKYGQYSEWTLIDKKILQHNHNTMTCREIQQKFFPDRSYTSIEKQIYYLGLKKRYEIKWTDEENIILKKNYITHSCVKLHKLFFSYRTLSSIKNHVRILGLKK